VRGRVLHLSRLPLVHVVLRVPSVLILLLMGLLMGLLRLHLGRRGQG
jgi:hypothetical protein